ncbi:MAG: hypothetical protein ACRYG7_43955 [Janthinobacterium lividum]
MDTFCQDELEAAWELETGFLGCLREGLFDPILYANFLATLRRIRLDEHALLPRRLVTLLWFIPLFMEWQTERVMANLSLEEYQAVRTQVETQLERILGFP